MPEEIVAALARVAESLPEVHWAEPEQLRRIGRGRRRRRTVVSAFAVVALISVGASLARTVDLPEPGAGRHGATATASAACPDGLVPAHVALPNLNQIKVNVYNGTKEDDLAVNVGGELRSRGLTVLKTGDGTPYEGTARIMYGPSGVGAAWVMQSFFTNQAESFFDIERTGADVDVVVGTAFQQIATPAELNQYIASLGRAALPPGTCEVD